MGSTTSTWKVEGGLEGSGVEDVENDESIYRINNATGEGTGEYKGQGVDNESSCENGV